MSLDLVQPGNSVPEEFNVIIDIPSNGDPEKYEVDKESGAIFVDRLMSSAMYYPANYVYIPRTLVRGRRPGGCHGRHPAAAASGFRGLLPARRHAGNGGRIRA